MTLTVITTLGTFVIDTENLTSSLNGGTPRPYAKMGYDGRIACGRTLWMVLEGSKSGRARYCGRVLSIKQDGQDVEAVIVNEIHDKEKPDMHFRLATENMEPEEFAKHVMEQKPFGWIVPKKVDEKLAAMIQAAQEAAGE